MDPSFYKDRRTSRGLKYHYFYVPAADSRKPTILLVHGFPSTSYDWHHQAKHLTRQGYGVLIPDLLGYGGTDKPERPEYYRMSLMCKDLVDILDHERLRDVVAVGHDWGSLLTSRLWTYHPNRFRAYGFLSLGFVPILPDFDLNEVLQKHREAFGYELIGYLPFFDEDNTANVLAKHFDSFFSVIFPADPKLFKTVVGPSGELKKWIQKNKTAPLPSFLNEHEKKKRKDILLRGGFVGPLCWYKAFVRKITAEEERSLSTEKADMEVKKPVLFLAAKHDHLNRTDTNTEVVEQLCPRATIVEINAGHWLQLEKPAEVNDRLTEWLRSLPRN